MSHPTADAVWAFGMAPEDGTLALPSSTVMAARARKIFRMEGLLG
jgi:hypothetical protein